MKARDLRLYATHYGRSVHATQIARDLQEAANALALSRGEKRRPIEREAARRVDRAQEYALWGLAYERISTQNARIWAVLKRGDKLLRAARQSG